MARVRRQRWATENPEKNRQCKKTWDDRHPDRVRAKRMAWHANNRACCRNHTRNYRAVLGAAPGTCTAKQLQARIDFYGGLCWVPGCRKPFEEMDHVIALSRGGSNWPANLRPICRRHNRIKATKDWRLV